MPKKNTGFTIIEVVLFLAISGLVLLIAFMGVGGRNRRAQFTDSMRSLQSEISQIYSDVSSGVNVRDSTQGCTYSGTSLNIGSASATGASDCTLLGRLIVFNPGSSQVKIYVVVGKFLSYSDIQSISASAGDKTYIQRSNPYIYPSLDKTYDLRWGTEFYNATRGGYDSASIAFLRSPASSSIYPVAFDKTTVFTPGAKLDIGPAEFGSAVSTHYCFKGVSGQDAEISIGGTSSDNSVKLLFDTGCSR